MAGGCNSQVEQVLLALLALGKLLHASGDGFQIGLHLSFVAVGLQFLQCLFLLQTNGGVVDFQNVNGILVLQTVLVGTYDGLNARVDAGLCACGSLFDAHLGQTGLDGLCHTAQLLDFLDVLPSLVVEFLGELLHIV